MMEILTDPFWRTVCGVIIGALVGSFLNVCATRIPQGLSIIFPKSSCPQCKEPVKWIYNLPILSWLQLGGKAKCCAFKIPRRYLFVEFFTAIFFGFLFFQFLNFGNWGFILCGMIYVSLLVVVIAIDFENMIIPDRFSIGGAILGICLSFSFPSLHGFSSEPIFIERISSLFTALVGLLLSSAVLYWIGAIAEKLMGKEALGQGDVKLLGLVGAFCGWQGGLFVIFAGALIGTVLLVPIMIFTKLSVSVNISAAQDRVGWGTEVPFGPFLGIAAIIYFLGLQKFVDSWFDQIISNFIHIFSIL